MINHGMEYNSQKEDLVIAEYGRNIQDLINHAKTIEDDEKRQAFAEAIVSLMAQMNPSQKYDIDYQEKLWRHLFRISRYEINVIPQSGVVPTPESSEYHPTTIPYPENQTSFRHYGQLVKELVQKAIAMEDPEKKHEMAMIIAAYMKLAYRTWNRDHYANDEIIKDDLKAMSKGKLILTDEHVIDISAVPQQSRTKGRRDNNSNAGRYRKNNRNNKGPKRRR